MKCSHRSEGMVRTIMLCCVDILEDKSSNNLKTTLEMMKGQIEMIEQMESFD